MVRNVELRLLVFPPLKKKKQQPQNIRKMSLVGKKKIAKRMDGCQSEQPRVALELHVIQRCFLGRLKLC